MTPKELARTWQLIPTIGNPCINPDADAKVSMDCCSEPKSNFLSENYCHALAIYSGKRGSSSSCSCPWRYAKQIRTRQIGASELIWLHTLGSMKLQNVILILLKGSIRKRPYEGNSGLHQVIQIHFREIPLLLTDYIAT
jgi:hypothetical protein